MPDETPMWEKIPPKENETPEEIRRQRDLYRDIVDAEILEMWRHTKLEDWCSEDGRRPEIRKMIEDLEANLAHG